MGKFMRDDAVGAYATRATPGVRRSAALAALLFSTVWAATAQGALLQWGTFTEGSTRLCPAGLCSGTFLQQSSDGGLLQDTSSVAYVPADPATTPGNDFGAQAALVGGLELPELKAFAIAPADPDRFTSGATARGIQGFEFLGTEAQTYTLDVALTGTVVGSGSLSGFIIVFDSEGFDPDVELAGARIASTSFFRTATSGSTPTALTFTLAPGDAIYVSAALFAAADSRGRVASVADAFHTLTLSFANPAGLAAASAAVPTGVPEPLSGGLLAAGIAAVFLLRRRVVIAQW